MVSSTAKRHARARACASSSSTSSSPNLTADRVALSASRRNIRLRYDGLGPAFRVTATAALDCEGDGQEGEEVGHVTGFWLPTGYVHFDEMRVPRTARGRSQGAFGTGLLLGCYALCRLREKGCETAELLAINDNPYQYDKLVRYYERMGFDKVREVGSGESPWLVDLGDQLVWGGTGMLMRARVDDVIEKWARSFREK